MIHPELIIRGVSRTDSQLIILCDSDRHGFIELRGTRREESVVRVAPNPPLSRLDRADQRVTCTLDMLVHVLVLGGIAAAHVTADQAHAQVGPAVAQVNAILAHVRVRFPHLDEMQVGAGLLLDLAGESQFKEELRYSKAGRFGHRLY